MNINSFIKYSSIILGAIGLIFTAYRIFDETNNKRAPAMPLRVAITKNAAVVPVSADLREEAVPEEQKKY